MRKLFLIGAVLLSATAAQAGLSDHPELKTADAKTAGNTQPPSGQRPDDSALAARRQAMIQQKQQITMRKQMAMQREMQRHPIRTRIHFGLLNLKRKLHAAFR